MCTDETLRNLSLAIAKSQEERSGGSWMEREGPCPRLELASHHQVAIKGKDTINHLHLAI